MSPAWPYGATALTTLWILPKEAETEKAPWISEKGVLILAPWAESLCFKETALPGIPGEKHELPSDGGRETSPLHYVRRKVLPTCPASCRRNLGLLHSTSSWDTSLLLWCGLLREHRLLLLVLSNFSVRLEELMGQFPLYPSPPFQEVDL